MGGIAGRIGESDLCILAIAAAPQFSANYELEVFIEVHMDDLIDTTETCAGLGPNQPFTEIRFKIWTVYEMGMRYEHLKRERVLHGDTTEIVPNHARVQTPRRDCWEPAVLVK